MDSKFEIDYDEDSVQVKILVDVRSDEWDWEYNEDYGIFEINFIRKKTYD